MIHYPENVVKLAKIFSKYNRKAYAVGGCIRDSIMNISPADWDITTNASPEEIIEICQKEDLRYIPTGLKHGTVSILLDQVIYECTTFRIDGSYTDSRHPDKVTFTNDLKEDLRRRDFTANAMAGDPLFPENDPIDPFGGMQDIKNKVIRAVGDPEKRFTEDALRILRAIRFATVLDFEIDKDTFVSAKSLVHRLADISAERKSTELEKILLSGFPDRGIELLMLCGAHLFIHKDISMPKIKIATLEKSFEVRLASLFSCGVPELSSMKLSNSTASSVRLLCDSELYERTACRFNDAKTKARYMLSVYHSLASSAAELHGDLELSDVISSECEKYHPFCIGSLEVNGNELMSLSIPQKQIGRVLQELLLQVIIDPTKNDKKALLLMAQEIFDEIKE